MADNRREEMFRASEPATSMSTPSSNAVSSRPRLLLKQPWLVIVLVVVVVLLVGGAWLLYYYTKGDRTFGHSLADVLLQAAVVVLAGAVLNELIRRDRRVRDKEEEKRNKRINMARDEEQERRNKQMNFMRRMRAAHVRIANAQRLIYACPSHDTYSEQMRVLMLVISELEDIEQDVAATAGLFRETDKADIQNGINDIVEYLEEGYYEYAEWSRNEVEEVWSHQADMEWIVKLGNSQCGMPKKYLNALNKSKGKLRSYAYGAGIDEVEPERVRPQ